MKIDVKKALPVINLAVGLLSLAVVGTLALGWAMTLGEVFFSEKHKLVLTDHNYHSMVELGICAGVTIVSGSQGLAEAFENFVCLILVFCRLVGVACILAFMAVYMYVVGHGTLPGLKSPAHVIGEPNVFVWLAESHYWRLWPLMGYFLAGYIRRRFWLRFRPSRWTELWKKEPEPQFMNLWIEYPDGGTDYFTFGPFRHDIHRIGWKIELEIKLRTLPGLTYRFETSVQPEDAIPEVLASPEQVFVHTQDRLRST